MTRPSQKTDEKLIEAAIAMLPSTGYSGLSMRAVAKKAGVNLGMFHYHFKNKEAFIDRVATEFYGRFYKTFTLEVAAGKDPKEQLAKAMVSLIKFARTNRQLLLAMIRDVLDGNQQLVRLLEGFIPQHGTVLLQLIRQCQKEQKLANEPLPLVMTFLIGSMAGPVVLAALLEQVKLRQPYDFLKKFAVPYVLSDKVIEKRLTLAFRGLAPSRGESQPDSGWEKKTDQFLSDLVVSVEKESRKKQAKAAPTRVKKNGRRKEP